MSSSGSGAKDIEEGRVFTPRYDRDGLVPCITSDAETGEVLMLAYMNAEALRLTLATGVVHYWSRSRQAIWRKGDTSGQRQDLVELRIDCDQDAVWARVRVAGDGDSCHTGRRSCFYRRIEFGAQSPRLVFLE